MSLADFKALAKKYSVSTSGSRTTLAETISNLRGRYLTKAEIEMIQPYLKKQTKNKKILLKIHYPVAKKKAAKATKATLKSRLKAKTAKTKLKSKVKKATKKNVAKKSPKKSPKKN